MTGALVIFGIVMVLWSISWVSRRPGWAQRAIQRNEYHRLAHERDLDTPCQYCFGTVRRHDAGCPDDPAALSGLMAVWDIGWRAGRRGDSNLKPTGSTMLLGFRKGQIWRESMDQAS